MEILQHQGRPETRRAFVIRSKPWVNLAAALSVTAMAGVALWLLAFRADLGSPWQWLFMAPFLGVGALLLLLVVGACWGCFRASLQDTNWAWSIREQEVWISLRDYRNANRGDVLPVLRLPTDTLERAVVVVETYQRTFSKGGRNHGTQSQRRKVIDLYVRDLDVSAVEAALNEERKHPGRVSAKGAGKTKFRTQPVTLIGEVGLRVPYSKRLRFALEHVVRFEEETVHVDLNQEWRGWKPLERALALHGRGHEFAAHKLLVREEGLTLREAKELLENALEARATDAA